MYCATAVDVSSSAHLKLLTILHWKHHVDINYNFFTKAQQKLVFFVCHTNNNSYFISLT